MESEKTGMGTLGGEGDRHEGGGGRGGAQGRSGLRGKMRKKPMFDVESRHFLWAKRRGKGGGGEEGEKRSYWQRPKWGPRGQ